LIGWGAGSVEEFLRSYPEYGPVETTDDKPTLFLRAADAEQALGLLRFESLRPLSGPGHRHSREDDYERDFDGVEELGGQRSSRLAEQLGEKLLDSSVPGQGCHQPQSRGYQLREFVQDFGGQRCLLPSVPYFTSAGMASPFQTSEGPGTIHLGAKGW
jgi:hypothetical protein